MIKFIKDKWRNIVLFFVLLSLIQIILDTLPTKSNTQNISLFLLELFITIVFVADYIYKIILNKKSPKHKNIFLFLLTPGMIIDLLSILPFFVMMFNSDMQMLNLLKLFRLFRLLKLFQVFEAHSLIVNAIKNKKNELYISTQVVLLITIILSIVLYYVENSAQPENFSSIISALLWSLAKFTGGIGGFGDFTPITFVGKMLATIVGVLVIAIFAIPAGIISSGFIEEINKKNTINKIKKNNSILYNAMQFDTVANEIRIKQNINLDAPKRRYLETATATNRLYLSKQDIYNILKYGQGLHLRSYFFQKKDYDVLESFNENTIYGTFEDNQSSITIISLFSHYQPLMGTYAYFLSRYLHANFISNEKFDRNEFREIYRKDFIINDFWVNNSEDNILEIFLDDLKKINHNSKLIVFVQAAGGKTPDYHILNGGGKGSKGFIENGTFENIKLLEKFNQHLKTTVASYDQSVTTHKYYGNNETNNIVWYIKNYLSIDNITIGIHAAILKENRNIFYNSIKNVGDSIKYLYCQMSER